MKNDAISFIVKFIPILDIVKSRKKVITTEEIGSTESTGIPGVNTSFKMELSDNKHYLWKPKSGEKTSSWRHVPPKTLYQRERAAYLIDNQLGFGLVPEVVIAQYGSDVGSLQSWVDPAYHISGDYMEFIDGLDYDQRIKAGLLDIIIGNTDRHGKNFLVSLEEI